MVMDLEEAHTHLCSRLMRGQPQHRLAEEGTMYIYTCFIERRKTKRVARKLSQMHCKDTIPKIRNKCSLERNCAATVPPKSYIHVSVSDL